MNLQEKRLSEKTLFEGNILKLRVDTVQLPNGKQATREVVAHPGAVAVVPVTDDGKIVLVRQYRYPIGQIMLEIPAGKLDAGEAPEACAQRELSEETGFTAGQLTKITSIYTTPGFSDEIIHLYLAKNLKKAEQHLDEDEFINVECCSPQQVKKLIAQGEINDAKSLVGLLMAGV